MPAIVYLLFITEILIMSTSTTFTKPVLKLTATGPVLTTVSVYKPTFAKANARAVALFDSYAPAVHSSFVGTAV